MTPAEFRQKIVDERILRFFDYWQRIRGDRLLPAWKDIRPEEIASLLPNVWAWRIGKDDQPRVRLVGENIAEMHATQTKGKSLFDLYPQDYATDLLAEFGKIAREPACSHLIGTLFSAGQLIGTGERLALPYGVGGREATGVFGISYHQRTGPIYTSQTMFSKLTGERHFLRVGVPE